jgi:hypothetical protein
MDAEAYSEASSNVLQILWGIIGSSNHPDLGLQWAKARASGFEALIQYEVNLWMVSVNFSPLWSPYAFNKWTLTNPAFVFGCCSCDISVFEFTFFLMQSS